MANYTENMPTNAGDTPMFKEVVFKLSEPICLCPEENLRWYITLDKKNKPDLEIQCKTCGTSIMIPSKKLLASFSLKNPYPGKKPAHSAVRRKKPKPLFKTDERGVIQLFPDKKPRK